MDRLGIILQKDLVPGEDLFFSKYFVLREKINTLFRDPSWHCGRKAFQIIKTSLFGLLDPFVGVTVSVKDNPLMLVKKFLKECVYLVIKPFGGYILKLFVNLFERFRNSGIEHDICVCNGYGRAGHTEFKLVSGECKG